MHQAKTMAQQNQVTAVMLQQEIERPRNPARKKLGG